MATRVADLARPESDLPPSGCERDLHGHGRACAWGALDLQQQPNCCRSLPHRPQPLSAPLTVGRGADRSGRVEAAAVVMYCDDERLRLNPETYLCRARFGV